MAVSIAVVTAGTRLHIADVTATADADVTATIPHGLPVAPTIVILTPLLTVVSALSAWVASTIDATNVVCTATAAVGSGAPGAQLRVTAMAPHSIIS